MPKDFLQGASLTPTFEALMVKIGGKIGTLYQMLKNALKKHPLQNRTNVQIKGGGVKGLLNNVKKNCTFLSCRLPLLFSFSVLKVGVPVKKQHVSDYQQELPELKTGTPRGPHVRDQTGDFSPDSSPRRLIL